ncbi:dTDP-4-amino-4,6-dideoxy-D-galactose acyltransferase [Affinibrenneria salicis]|uniref:dTDP-fucosamine acetyltransferase n=1 Tax=Affinibrenneria salicis TaxID=2590031 RepID=A0A5J5FTT4_9GAMM|nr:dTDP-4-amino-4,6-dideoxy-D-galactose acyltransferase [Affinibrenneria salicis]KAA8996463.1 dTDP-4-amino-4,6-dideoxy-D-galactose acyltransferase [Affinibrenneria salicis]
MTINAGLGELSWESAFFQRPSARLDFSPDAAPLTPQALAAWPLVQAKIPAERLDLADELASLGFRLAESEVDLCLTLTPSVDGAPHDDGLRVAQDADIAALRAVAATRIALSRFRAPWYRPQDSGRFYAQWVENAVRGTFDHQCLLLEDRARRPLGFVTLRQLEQEEARIGLLASWPHVGGCGDRLMAAAVAWCRRRRIVRLRVATQISNVAALRLYIRSGAVIDGTAYWLYR